eukprot:4279055-Alexandrium_andersonii.AAC.1
MLCTSNTPMHCSFFFSFNLGPELTTRSAGARQGHNVVLRAGCLEETRTAVAEYGNCRCRA